MVDINIAIPFIDAAGQEAKYVFMQSIFQVDLKLDFGNIALTYVGGRGFNKGDAITTTTYEPIPGQFADAAGTQPIYREKKTTVGEAGFDEPGTIFGYLGMGIGDSLSLDVGFGFTLPNEATSNPVNAGVGVKYATDTFGVKFRAAISIPLEEFQSMEFMADVLPFFNVNDSMRAYVSVGLGMKMPSSIAPSGEENVIGWHFNPYLEVGQEWGPKFLVGIGVSSNGVKDADGKSIIGWGVPVALMVSF
jgi:hypothetical protein